MAMGSTISVPALKVAVSTAEAKTANFAAAAGGKYAVDTTAGVVIATLPASPNDGESVLFVDPSGIWATNNFAVNGNGSPMFGIVDGVVVNVVGNLVCDFPARVELFFLVGFGWSVILGPPGTAGADGGQGDPGATGAQGPAGAAFESASSTVVFTADAYTTIAGDLSKTLLCTTGSVDKTITLLAAATAGDGKMMAFRKVDSGTGKVMLLDAATARAWLMTQFDHVYVRSNGTTWEVTSYRIADRRTVYAANATYTKPPLLKDVFVWGISGGSGGGSGRRRAASSAGFGGGGGAPGGIAFNLFAASELGTTEAIVVGAAAAGGAAVTVDSTDGNAGTNGHDTTFGSKLTAKAGNGGAGGSATAGAGGAGPVATSMRVPVASGAASSITATPTSVGSNVVGGGGGGGGVSAGDVARAGGTGGTGSIASPTVVGGGTGGAATGAAGTTPSDVSDTLTQEGGAGGGGGGGNSSGAGGNGGNGSTPGGGGGGGGSGTNGANSGAGGTGPRGEVRVLERF